MAGFTSTTGVPSIASRASTSIRSPSRATMRARCRPMGFGRLGEQVLNTPVSGWLMSSSGWVVNSSRGTGKSGEHHNLVARSQALAPPATCSSKRIHARGRLRAGSAHRRGPSGPTAPIRSARGRSSFPQRTVCWSAAGTATRLPRSIRLGPVRVLLELLDQCDAVCNLAASGPTQQQPAPRSADGPGLPRTAVRTLQRRARVPFRYVRDVPDQVQRESSQRATTPVCPE